MSNVLNIAYSGLQANQKAIATTGDNIVNAGKEGYSRKTMDFVSRDSTRFGVGYIGNGVDIAAIVRNTDEFAVKQIREAVSIYESVNEYFLNARALDGLLSSEDSSLATSLQQFYSAVQGVNANPTDTASRQVLLSQSNALVQRFGRMNAQLDRQVSELNGQLKSMVANVNSLANSLAEINKKIVGGSTAAPELLDQRDLIVKEIASLVNVQAIEEGDGTISLNMGNGISLVTNAVATEIGAIRSNDNPELLAVAIVFNGQSYQITDRIQGGKMGGLVTFRDELLLDARNSVNRIALALGAVVNEQNQLGMDLTGNLGKSFFNDINTAALQQGRAIQNYLNSGNLHLSVEIDDVSQLTISEYRLNVSTGPTYQLVRASDNTSFAIGSFPATIDGFTINIDSGAAAAGDSFIISPNFGAASAFKLNINSINDFAIASPIRASRNTANLGTGTISPGEVVDTSNASFTTTPGALNPPIRVEFLSSTSYQIVNANSSAVIEGPLVYDPANENQLFPTSGAYDPGYRISISGAVQTGDEFNIGYNTGGVSDNRNGNLLAGLQTKNILEGGTISIPSAYSALVSEVGTETRQSEIGMEASKVLFKQSVERLESVAGVNLDEEAANLLKYQQAYQASAQVISVASRLFDTLLGAFQ